MHRPCIHWGEAEVPRSRINALLMRSDRKERNRMNLMINKTPHRELWG